MCAYRAHFVDFDLTDPPSDAGFIQIIRELWANKYLDLYDTGGSADVQYAFRAILDRFGEAHDPLAHERYVYTLLCLALACRTTLTHYFPDDDRPRAVLKYVREWLENSSERVTASPGPDFSDYQTGAHTPAREAYNVYFEVLAGLDPSKAYEATENALQDALAGDAISSYYEAKRDLFNWWLLELVPAAYQRQLPTHIYTARGLLPLAEAEDTDH